MEDPELIGQTIIDIRDSTEEEREQEGWNENFTVIELKNGNRLYPSRDSEGNGPGALFGCTNDDNTFGI